MSPQPEESVSIAVAIARLDDLREDVRGMRSDLATHRAELVPRGEWEQRNRHVDARHQEIGREVGGLRASLETKTAALEQKIDARRMPWPAVAGAVTGIGALALTIIQIVP